MADGRRPVRPRARDRVRQPGGLRRDLVALVQPDPTLARERGDPRLADDDVLRRALLHAPAPGRHARDVERAPRHLLCLGLESAVPARHHRPTHRAQPGPGVRRVHLAARHRAARDLVRERREHPGDGRDPDDPADLRLGLVLHREPALAGGRLRDRQRDLAPGPHLGRAVGRAQPEPLRRDAELVVRAQPVRPLADADVARADLLHRPASHQHAALQLHALADQLLGDGLLLHRRRRPPHPPVADAGLAEDDRGSLLLDAARARSSHSRSTSSGR